MDKQFFESKHTGWQVVALKEILHPSDFLYNLTFCTSTYHRVPFEKRGNWKKNSSQ